MSSKTRWKQATVDLTKPDPKRGRAKHPTMSTISEVQPEISVEVNVAECSVGVEVSLDSQEEMLRAVIAAQRRTIDDYQKDLTFERGKVKELESKVRALHAKAKSQEDYNALKIENQRGYQGGYELGMAKVQIVYCLNSHSHVQRCSIFGKKILTWSLELL